MADNNYSIIKPVEGLQNIGGVTPIQHREEKRKKRQWHRQKEGEQKSADEELNKDEQGRNSIDFCA